jgi:multiple sugar transport system substrate-binding protein
MHKIKTMGVAVLAALLATTALADQTVRFWYHFDNPDNPMDELIRQFEDANPGIRIEAENIPWNSYYDNLYTAIVGGSAPDALMVKLFAQPRLLEMGALTDLTDRIADWDGREQLLDNILTINAGPDGRQYYLPVQYVVLYLYYNAGMFEEAGLNTPETCDDFLAAARALTGDTDGDGRTDRWGFGFRGARGGHDHWASFVLAHEGVDIDAGLTGEAGIAANQWVIDLHREHGVFPPSAPNDGFQEIIAGFQQERTAMTIHHIGSANAMEQALGDRVSAVPVPECGGGRWTAFGDESLAILSSAQDPDAAWKWISFLSSPGANALFNQATGQLPITKPDTEAWEGHPRRFVDATAASLPHARTLPESPATADFVNTVWPRAMQRALNGEITAEAMAHEIEGLFAGQ